MSSKQYIMQELDQKFKIKIKHIDNNGNTAIVEAPLPEQFGFTVGSEFTAPFDASTLGGILQKFKVPSMAATGLSKKVGVVTTKFYSNPEPTEISFDMEFHAEYSAKKEVVEPVLAMMAMSLGDAMTFDDVTETIAELRGSIESWVKSAFNKDGGGEDEGDAESSSIEVSEDWEATADGAMGLIGLIKGPNISTITFGNVYSLDNVWISSVSPQFSNVVDADGMPLSATCSITAIIQRDPVVADINRYFGAVSQGQAQTEEEQRREGLSPQQLERRGMLG